MKDGQWLPNPTHVLKVTVYEGWCDACDWTTTRAAGDPDAGTDRDARLNAVRACRDHRREAHGWTR